MTLAPTEAPPEPPNPVFDPHVNDFSLVVATANGTGSQTANLTLMRSFFRMGVPVNGKNVFPSNIQGLPTWFHIRVSKDGYLGRKESDLLVAFNPATVDADLRALPGRWRGRRPRRPAPVGRPRRHHRVRAARQADPRGQRGQGQGARLPRQHDLRRRAGVAARRPARGRRARAERAVRRATQAGRSQHADRPRGPRLGRREPREARSLPCRADGPHARPAAHDGQRGRGAGQRLRRRQRGRVVPDHAVDLLRRRRARVPPAAAPAARRRAELRHRAGRGRVGGRRHGHRGRLRGRPRADRDERPGHLADGGVHGARVLRRGAGRHLGRAAGRTEHGHADPHEPGRPRLHLHAGARRHAAPGAAAVVDRGVLRVRLAGVRSGRRVADPGVRPQRPRPRHEHLDGRALRLPGRAAAPRQGAVGRGGGGARLRALRGPRRGRDRLAHPAGQRPPARRVLRPRHRPQRAAVYSERSDDWVENMERLARKRETVRRRCPRRSSTGDRARASG